MEFSNLISCEAGVCKNISQIWNCQFENKLDLLKKNYGPRQEYKGWCNCQRCPKSNRTEDLTDSCPKETEFCFREDARPDLYDEKRQDLCKAPTCKTCDDICADRHQCLDMKNRRDVVYFGVDEYDDPLLTYYDCKDGECIEIYDMKCTRTCDAKTFDFNSASMALLQVCEYVMKMDPLTFNTYLLVRVKEFLCQDAEEFLIKLKMDIRLCLILPEGKINYKQTPHF